MNYFKYGAALAAMCTTTGIAQAQELTYANANARYYEYQRETNGTYTEKQASVSLGYNSGSWQYGFGIGRNEEGTDNPITQGGAVLGYQLSEKLLVMGGLSFWRQNDSGFDSDHYTSIYGRVEYNVSDTVRTGARYRRWSDDGNNTYLYATYEPNEGPWADSFMGLVGRYTSRDNFDRTEFWYGGQHNLGEKVKLYEAGYLETDNDRDWNYAIAVEYDVADKISLLGGFGANSDDNRVTESTYSLGLSYQINDTASLSGVYGAWNEDNNTTPSFGLSLDWKLGKAPHGERAIADARDKAYRIVFKR